MWKSRTEAVVILAEKTFCGSVTRLLEDELQNIPKRKTFWRSLVAPWRTAWRCEREENTAHVFKRKFPVNYRSSSKKYFKFPGNCKPILENESVVSLWRKRFFFKTLTTAGAVVYPRKIHTSLRCKELCKEDAARIGHNKKFPVNLKCCFLLFIQFRCFAEKTSHRSKHHPIVDRGATGQICFFSSLSALWYSLTQ